MRVPVLCRILSAPYTWHPPWAFRGTLGWIAQLVGLVGVRLRGPVGDQKNGGMRGGGLGKWSHGTGGGYGSRAVLASCIGASAFIDMDFAWMP